jgi:hypothetical protein
MNHVNALHFESMLAAGQGLLFWSTDTVRVFASIMVFVSVGLS